MSAGQTIDRDAAKAAILNRDKADAEYNQELHSAKVLELTLAGHEHEQKMRSKELGFLGWFIGGERNAPLSIALVALVVSLAVFAVIHILVGMDSVSTERVEGLLSAADKCLALATLALGYVCGKGSS